MKTLAPGKLDAALLARLLAQVELPSEVVIGPGVGRDVAVLDLGHDELLLTKTDPITFATDAIGYYLVAVNSNDLATSGGVPRWLLVTALLPEQRTTEGLVEDIFAQLRQACAATGISLIGGHTEITVGLDRPILIGQMLGTVARDALVRPDGTRPGDAILLTKGLPLEGVSLMAREKREDLLGRGYEPAFLDRCAGLLFDPGIMVLPEAQALCGALRHARPHRGWGGDRAVGDGRGFRRGPADRSRAPANPARGAAAVRGVRRRPAGPDRLRFAPGRGGGGRCGPGRGGVCGRRRALRADRVGH